jgi:hypothetical protein
MKVSQTSWYNLMKTVPGVGTFSNSNDIVLDQLISETKTDLKSSSSIQLNQALFTDNQTAE